MEATRTAPEGVEERPAAGAGVVIATVGLVGSVLSWPGQPAVTVGDLGSPLAGALSVVLLAAFLARRWGRADRTLGAPVAGVAAAALLGLAIVRLVAPAAGTEQAPAVGPGLALAMTAGLLGVGLALADYRGVSRGGLGEMGKRVAVGFALTVAAFVVSLLVSIPMGLVAVDEFTTLVVNVLSGLTEVGFVLVALGFLLATDRGLGWIDVSWPSLREVAIAVGGLFALLGLQVVVGLLVQSLGVPTSSNTVSRVAERAAERGHADLILLMVPVMIFVVGPAEELLYRGVIQKYFYGVFTRHGAVLAASTVFAAAHVLAYYDENPAALFVSLASVFTLSLLLGLLYERTENIVVPAVAHGTFNAVLVLLLYARTVVEVPETAMLLP